MGVVNMRVMMSCNIMLTIAAVENYGDGEREREGAERKMVERRSGERKQVITYLD